jgi:hypothetical protein
MAAAAAQWDRRLHTIKYLAEARVRSAAGEPPPAQQ